MVIVWMTENPSHDPTVVAEIATSVGRIFYGGVVPALGSEKDVEVALEKSRNVLAELGGLYLALWQAPANSAITIVHDYEGVASWMTGKWKAHEPVVRAIVDGCKQIVEAKQLDLSFQWQKGHTSSWAGRHDLHASTRERTLWQQLVALKSPLLQSSSRSTRLSSSSGLGSRPTNRPTGTFLPQFLAAAQQGVPRKRSAMTMFPFSSYRASACSRASASASIQA